MTDTSLDDICDAIARRIAKRKVAEINKRVAELIEQEFAESGDAADEPERHETGSDATRRAAPAQINGTLDVPAFLPSPEPAKSIDPDQSAAGGVLIPSMVAKQSGKFEAGETTAASAQGASSPVLCAPADPAAVEGDCGHEPPALSRAKEPEADAGSAATDMHRPVEGSSRPADGRSSAATSDYMDVTARRDEQPIHECAERDSGGVGARRIAAYPSPAVSTRTEKGTVNSIDLPNLSLETAARPAGPGPVSMDAGARAEGLRSSASVLAHSVGPAPPVSKHFELPDIPAFLRRNVA